jgi:hypothetical protein
MVQVKKRLVSGHRFSDAVLLFKFERSEPPGGSLAAVRRLKP